MAEAPRRRGHGKGGRNWPPPEERFRARIAGFKPEECWVYHSGDPQRYGSISVNSRGMPAHRFAWELLIGPIPSGAHVLHRCDNPPCVNPAHLFLGTHQDNVRDSTVKGRRARPAGEANGRAKVTPEIVTAIRANYTGAYGDLTRFARKHGIGTSQVLRIARGEQWR